MVGREVMFPKYVGNSPRVKVVTEYDVILSLWHDRKTIIKLGF